MNDHRPAIGYVRVSTDEQAREGVSLEAQRERIEGYCKAHGYTLLHVHEDAGMSGKAADNRPGLQAALRAVCQAKGVLVVTKLDRLARSTRDACDMTARIEKCGAELASIAEMIDTASAGGRFVFRLMASLAEMERDMISDRTKAALEYKRSKGERISGCIPYGFVLADDGVHLEDDDDEQAVIARMHDLRERGMSFGRIARVLTDEMVPAKYAKRWSAQTVKNVLTRCSA